MSVSVSQDTAPMVLYLLVGQAHHDPSPQLANSKKLVPQWIAIEFPISPRADHPRPLTRETSLRSTSARRGPIQICSVSYRLTESRPLSPSRCRRFRTTRPIWARWSSEVMATAIGCHTRVAHPPRSVSLTARPSSMAQALALTSQTTSRTGTCGFGGCSRMQRDWPGHRPPEGA